jgi:hypothetical protein
LAQREQELADLGKEIESTRLRLSKQLPDDQPPAAKAPSLVERTTELNQRADELRGQAEELAAQRRSFDEERARAAERMARESEELEEQRSALEAADARLRRESAESSAENLATIPCDEPAGESEVECAQEPDQELAAEAAEAEEEVLEDSVESVAEPATSQGSDSHEELSVEEYMANLLKRMRGGAASDAVAPPPPRRSKKKATPAEPIHHAAAPKVHENPPPVAVEKPMTLAELTRRAAPAPTKDLAAMRELANTQARIAIDTHGRKRLVNKILASFIAGVLCLVCTVTLLTLVHDDKALQTGSMVGLVAALYWMFGGWTAIQQLRGPQMSRKEAIRAQLDAAHADQKR